MNPPGMLNYWASMVIIKRRAGGSTVAKLSDQSKLENSGRVCAFFSGTYVRSTGVADDADWFFTQVNFQY